MAELKLLAEPPVVAAAVGVLHGLSAVAELKLECDGEAQQAALLVLHGLSAVAELKHADLVGLDGPTARFSTASAPWPN